MIYSFFLGTTSNLLPHLAGHMCNGGCFFAKRVNPLFYAPRCLPYASIKSQLRE